MKYRKKPVVVEAMQWNGLNRNAVSEFMGRCKTVDGRVRVETLEGVVYATPGDWIIKGVAGEFYPCRNDIFEATYEAVYDPEMLDSFERQPE